MMQKTTLRFATTKRDFVSVLNARVNDYFKEHKIAKHGNSEMFIKTVFMFMLYFVPYALILSNVVSGALGLTLCVVVMGLGQAGIGLSVMHDANHGAYSSKQWVNTVIGYSLNLLGVNSFNWKLQHNVLHHSYTNVHEEDEDISPRGALRLTPHTKWKAIHRYQYVYAWFLYGLMTLVWLFFKDFTRLYRYHRQGFARKHTSSVWGQWAILFATKGFYVGYVIILPLIVTPLLWWQVILGVVIMHYIAGFILAIIFQPAHVTESTEFPLPDENRMLENNWAVHQMLTTSNFGNGSRWFSWFVGGLNFQIEHHLFPNICHVHFRRIASIVRSTANEFGVPYYSSKTFLEALGGHARLLRKLGEKPV